eukprot:scaffold72318_cov90-Phaeocystis_antarctica.AAC.2
MANAPLSQTLSTAGVTPAVARSLRSSPPHAERPGSARGQAPRALHSEPRGAPGWSARLPPRQERHGRARGCTLSRCGYPTCPIWCGLVGICVASVADQRPGQIDSSIGTMYGDDESIYLSATWTSACSSSGTCWSMDRMLLHCGTILDHSQHETILHRSSSEANLRCDESCSIAARTTSRSARSASEAYSSA